MTTAAEPSVREIYRVLGLKFDPDQPRDESGKWTSGGGGTSAGQSDQSSNIPPITPTYSGRRPDEDHSDGYTIKDGRADPKWTMDNPAESAKPVLANVRELTTVLESRITPKGVKYWERMWAVANDKGEITHALRVGLPDKSGGTTYADEIKSFQWSSVGYNLDVKGRETYDLATGKVTSSAPPPEPLPAAASMEPRPSGGPAPKITREKGTSTAKFNKVARAVNAVPAAHLKRISHVAVTFYPTPRSFPSHLAASEGSTVGLFSWEDDFAPTISLAEKMDYRTPSGQTMEMPIRWPESVAVHEVGHAVDYVEDWKHSKALYPDFVKALREGKLTKKEMRNGKYWIENERELFAELYSATHNPNRSANQRYFGGMKLARVEAIFGDVIKKIREIKSLQILARHIPELVRLLATIERRPVPLLVILERQEFDESQHPRDESGKWTEGGGGGGSAGKPSAGKATMTDFWHEGIQVEGKPSDDDFESKDVDEEKFLEQYNEAFPGESPRQFIDSLTGGFMTEEAKLNYYSDKLEVYGHLFPKGGGKFLGDFASVFNFRTRVGEVGLLDLHPSAQGKGVAKQHVAAVVDKFKQAGMTKANLHADIDVGGYAWAKYGFVPTKRSWENFQPYLLHKLKDIEEGEPSKMTNAIRSLINGNDPRNIWAIADSKYGKELLTNSDWIGDLDFADADSMDRFDAYIHKGK